MIFLTIIILTMLVLCILWRLGDVILRWGDRMTFPITNTSAKECHPR